MSDDKKKLINNIISYREQSEGAKKQIDKKVNKRKLLSIDGIGEETAYQIIDQLEQKNLNVGQILEVDDLTDLKGIGPATAEDVKEVFAKDKDKKEPKDVEAKDDEEVQDQVQSKEDNEQESSQKDIEASPTARKLSQLRKEHSGPAQKYIGKTRR